MRKKSEKQGTTLKLVNYRMPRHWDAQLKTLADAKRTTKTGMVFLLVEQAYKRFRAEQEGL